MRSLRAISVVAAGVLALATPSAALAAQSGPTAPALLVSGLTNGFGSAVGPDGRIYVTESAAGRITAVDPATGARSTYASGLPQMIPDIGAGGAMDVAFLDGTAYALVTLVDPLVGGSAVDGIYRVDGPSSFTVVADIGTWSQEHPPVPAFFVPTGVQYAMQPFRGGFLVTDGHHNRVLDVSLDGTITEQRAFGNIVPTGLDVHGSTILMAEAGPVPHDPADGRVVAFDAKGGGVSVLASGAPLLVDVEQGTGRTLFALAQGAYSGGPEGSPALPDTGSLVRVNGDGTFNTLATGLDRPTSMEIIANTAYVVTLDGEIWRIGNLASAPFGR
jgi:hypothetical protein